MSLLRLRRGAPVHRSPRAGYRASRSQGPGERQAEPEAATRLMERIVEEVGVDDAWRLRSGVPSRLPWPTPASLRPRRPVEQQATGAEALAPGADPARTAAAHARLEAARQGYLANDAE